MSKSIRRKTRAAPIKLNVRKRNGQTQPFSRAKLTTSITRAGATQQQANLVSSRVANRLTNRQSITSKQLSSMTARSLSRVNTTASRNYASFRNNKYGTTRQKAQQSITTAPPPSTAPSTLSRPIDAVEDPFNPKPDLVITEVDYPDKVTTTERIHYSVKFKNIGKVNAEIMPHVSEELIRLSILDSKGKEVKKMRLDPKPAASSAYYIPPRREYSIKSSEGGYHNPFSPITEPGEYSVKVKIDPNNLIQEINERNNVYIGNHKLTIESSTELPDLAITGMEIEEVEQSKEALAREAAGECNSEIKYYVHVHIKNVGNGKSEQSVITKFDGVRGISWGDGHSISSQIYSGTYIRRVYPGETVKTDGYLRNYLESGTQRWVVELDYNEIDVMDTNLENNTATFDIRVGENGKIEGIFMHETYESLVPGPIRSSRPQPRVLKHYSEDINAIARRDTSARGRASSTTTNVIKRGGSSQRFNRDKLTRSIARAGATPSQANLVSNRVANRVATRGSISSRELSSMTARSLSRVNTTASRNYARFRNQKYGRRA